MFLNGEAALGQPNYVFATLIRDITYGDKYKTGHDAEGWRKEKLHLKGLSHEIDFKNVDNNLQYLLGLTKRAAGFQPRPLLRPRSVNFRQHFRNLSRKTVR